MKNENYLLTLDKIIPLYYEDVQGLITQQVFHNKFMLMICIILMDMAIMVKIISLNQE